MLVEPLTIPLIIFQFKLNKSPNFIEVIMYSKQSKPTRLTSVDVRELASLLYANLTLALGETLIFIKLINRIEFF